MGMNMETTTKKSRCCIIMIDETQIIKEIRKLAADAERGRRRALRPPNGNWPDLIAALAYKVRYDNCKDILGIIDRYTSVDDKGGQWVLS